MGKKIDELERLHQKRNQIEELLTRSIEFANTFDNKKQKIQLVKARLDAVKGTFKELADVQSDIVALSKDLDYEKSLFVEIEQRYFEAVAVLQSIVDDHKEAATDKTKEQKTTQNKIALPVIQIPEFSGSYEKWLSFRDLYTNLVHENKNLSATEKMHYLRSSLRGDALRAIETLCITNSNYETAWELLKERFENKRLIIHAHVKRIIHFPNITKATHNNLRELIDELNINLESLKLLGISTDTWDAMLVPIITEKLDFHTNREWQSKLSKTLPTYEQLKSFLRSRCEYLESIAHVSYSNNNQKAQVVPCSKTQNVSKFKGSATHLATNKRVCLFCKRGNHLIFQCSNFLRLNVSERKTQIKNLNLCENCLRHSHNNDSCPSKKTCTKCNQGHNTLLHVDLVEISTPTSEPIPTTTTQLHCGIRGTQKEILLSTATVLIKDIHGQYKKCRLLLDNGSQSNFMTKRLVELLGIQTKISGFKITGIGGKQHTTTESADIVIKSRHREYSKGISCLVLDEITNKLPAVSFSITELKIPDIQLADEEFNISNNIDLLLGAELFLELICDGKIQLKNSNLYMLNTQLGWIFGGILFLNGNSTKTCSFAVTNNDLNEQLERFWSVESHKINKGTIYSLDEQTAEENFIQTTRRTCDGRFIVSLPIKGGIIDLGNSEEMAKRRFLNLEKRLMNNTELKAKYTTFMKEYRELGHMELVLNEDSKKASYFLPHHGVYKENDPNSKLRVVFDASAKSSNSRSLNDNLLTGPNIQQELLWILVRFRIYQYVFSADIIKMYRQIWINPDQTNLQKIFWRDQPNEPLETYRLKTVTYGTSSAPFLAIRCLRQLGQESIDTDPQVAKVLANDFYMDDVITGSNNLHDLICIRQKLTEILQSGGFLLSKWATNDTSLFQNDSNGKRQSEAVINLDKETITKTLGLYWNCQEDTLQYDVKQPAHQNKTTKRVILSTLSKIFDPLGLLGPIIIKIKILMQQLWVLKLDWDQPVPDDTQKNWTQLLSELAAINFLKIPRLVLANNYNKIELHGFADASERAYGAAIYIKSVTSGGYTSVNLLVAKSRVTPLKVLSIPRLELLAAQLLAQLMSSTISNLSLNISSVSYWTDSTIVLAWLSKSPTTWQTFVANRVAEIQTLTSSHTWRHVNSADNPADIISRGMSPQLLINNDLWWHGPQWLAHKNSEFPIHTVIDTPDIPEAKGIPSVVLLATDELDLLSRFCTFTRLRRVTAYILRFINNCKNKTNAKTGHLSVTELDNSSIVISRLVQKQAFQVEFSDLMKGRNVHKSSPLSSLNPFIDKKGIIRVGGRLKHSNLSFDQKHPIVLPKNHKVTSLIVECYHLTLLHAGAQATLAGIRQSFWPISGRSVVRKVLHKCIKCFRARPSVNNQIMGDLPIDRVEPARPFINTGVDYCGPILIKESRGRGKRSIKSYICLFVCLSSKAVHIELVYDLTTESFLNALKRLISRRGTVRHFRSDNATNFTAGNKELIDLAKFFKNSDFAKNVITVLENDNIKWSFAPPRSPNFSGLMEAGVKSVKYHLRRVIGDQLLSYDEMYTLLTRIEACLNSRPLVPLSNDPNDFTALTPGHLLIGQALIAPLEPDLREIKLNRLSRFQLLEQMRQHFWSRWQKEFVSQLQSRNKWTTSTRSIQVGDLVLLKEDNTPPMCWPLSRVLQVHPGSDDKVRVVTVNTSKGTYKRGVSRVCVLPIEDTK